MTFSEAAIVIAAVATVATNAFLFINDKLKRKELNSASIKAKKEATDATTQAWIALYEAEKEARIKETLQLKNDAMKREMSLQDQIKVLEECCEQYEREIARWRYIGERLNLNAINKDEE